LRADLATLARNTAQRALTPTPSILLSYRSQISREDGELIHEALKERAPSLVISSFSLTRPGLKEMYASAPGTRTDRDAEEEMLLAQAVPAARPEARVAATVLFFLVLPDSSADRRLLGAALFGRVQAAQGVADEVRAANRGPVRVLQESPATGFGGRNVALSVKPRASAFVPESAAPARMPETGAARLMHSGEGCDDFPTTTAAPVPDRVERCHSGSGP
jgi:hypothetical protein